MDEELSECRKAFGEWFAGEYPLSEYIFDHANIEAMKISWQAAWDSRAPAADMIAMPLRLTAENGAKGALMGEFYESIEVRNPDYCDCGECNLCETFPNADETITEKVPVSWPTIKKIYAKVVELLGKPLPVLPEDGR